MTLTIVILRSRGRRIPRTRRQLVWHHRDLDGVGQCSPRRSGSTRRRRELDDLQNHLRRDLVGIGAPRRHLEDITAILIEGVEAADRAVITQEQLGSREVLGMSRNALQVDLHGDWQGACRGVEETSPPHHVQPQVWCDERPSAIKHSLHQLHAR